VQGQPGSRRWLVYAHSPLEHRHGVEITLPDFGKLTMAVSRAGAFSLIDEQRRSATPVGGRKKGTGPFFRNGPERAAHKWCA
jgi:hypothetical protein